MTEKDAGTPSCIRPQKKMGVKRDRVALVHGLKPVALKY
jgi:hypothetical protein